MQEIELSESADLRWPTTNNWVRKRRNKRHTIDPMSILKLFDELNDK